jgi:hypothetical protein
VPVQIIFAGDLDADVFSTVASWTCDMTAARGHGFGNRGYSTHEPLEPRFALAATSLDPTSSVSSIIAHLDASADAVDASSLAPPGPGTGRAAPLLRPGGAE